MKANEFVKKFGWFITTRLVKKVDATNNPHFPILLEDLKRLVESHELVEAHGGLPQAREVAHANCFDYPMRLLQAIVDMESCK